MSERICVYATEKAYKEYDGVFCVNIANALYIEDDGIRLYYLDINDLVHTPTMYIGLYDVDFERWVEVE